MLWRQSRFLSLFISARLIVSSPHRLGGSRFGSQLYSHGINMQARSASTVQVGLTGSIGMGKSTISNQLIKLGFPLFDADREVHRLYSPNGAAVSAIGAVYPEVVVDGMIDRAKLSAVIMKDPSSLRVVENIVHPMIFAERQQFFEAAREAGKLLVVYDIPLLYENIDKHKLDYIVVATASADVQYRRVLDRPGMTAEKFAAILQKQVPDAEKRQKADFLVHTDYEGYSEAKCQLATVIESIIEKNPELWDNWKSGVSGSCKVAEIPAGLTELETSVRGAIDMVVFDLDDTLVPVLAQLTEATAALRDYLAEHMPRTAAVAEEALRPAMKSVMLEFPLIAHDLTEVRRRALLQIATPFDEQHHVEAAIEVFFRVRSDVSRNFYSDTAECLEWLHSIGVKLGVFTNGSADLSQCDLLNKYLSLTFTAADVGLPKPSPVGFVACAQVGDVPPNRVLYIGDSYECDVLGANNAGMISGMLLRKESTNKEVLEESVLSEEELAGHHQLTYPAAHLMLRSLRVADLQAALKKYLNN